MSELVSDDIYILSIAGDDGWGSEGVDRVLHAAVREGGRKDKDIILTPRIVVDERFASFEEAFGIVLQFPFATRKLIGASGDGGSGPDRGEGEVARRNGKEVRRNGH